MHVYTHVYDCTWSDTSGIIPQIFSSSFLTSASVVLLSTNGFTKETTCLQISHASCCGLRRRRRARVNVVLQNFRSLQSTLGSWVSEINTVTQKLVHVHVHVNSLCIQTCNNHSHSSYTYMYMYIYTCTCTSVNVHVYTCI